LFFFSSRRRHTRFSRDWSSDVCSSDLWVLRRTNLVQESAWPGISRLTYVGLSPALLFSVISKADFSTISVGPAVAAAALGFVVKIGRASCRGRAKVALVDRSIMNTGNN